MKATMDSSTPCCARRRWGWLEHCRSLALAGLTALSIAANAFAADGIEVLSASIAPSEDGYLLESEFEVNFSPRLEEAVNRGVPLYFVVDFEMARPRWYWFDEKPVQISRTYKISYAPLLRQYRLEMGSAYQNFTRFEDVKRVLSRVRGVTVAEKAALAKGAVYQASIRMRLDTNQLPKPFQLNALASNEWTLSSNWYRWNFVP
jgi:hypothetical protein